MKKYQVIFVNLLIVCGILLFVVGYAREQWSGQLATQKESFQNMTQAMEQVTANYLIQEQRLCDNWAAYVNNHELTLDSAVQAVSDSQAHKDDVMAHIIYVDDQSLEGLSTHARQEDGDDFSVSYRDMNLFKGLGQMGEVGTVNVTRAYANPTNGIQSIAFYARVHVFDEAGATRDALLLRVVPTTSVAKKWSFPSEEYKDAEISLIDGDGNYIIRSHSFEGSSFFGFYKANNEVERRELSKFERDFVSTSGTFTMLNANHEECLAGHCPVSQTHDWAIISLVLMQNLSETSIDWVLILIVGAGLLSMLAFDMLVMLSLNRRERLAAQAAGQASKAKSEFLSNMSHEIRTPITAILGMNELIQRESEKESVLSYSDNIQKAGKSLLGIISDILDFSKIEAGHIELEDMSYSTANLIGDIVTLTHLQAEGKGLAFRTNVDPTIPKRLQGDVLRVKQVVTNLLSNAVKYTKEGSVELSVSLVRTGGGKATIHVAVSDTGIGIRDEEKDRLFSAFERLDTVHTRHIEGTGLGLAISSQMLKVMGSELQVRSEYGKGSTFFFDLVQGVVNPDPLGDYDPLATVERKESRRRRAPHFVAPDARIMVVDDTPMNLQVIVGLLKRTQMHIETAESGAECIDRFGVRDYDLVLLDYRMPGMDGIETLHVMRDLYPQRYECTPIICLTASAVSGDRERMLSAGFTNYLPKPVNIDDLEEMLAKELPSQKVRLLEDESTAEAMPSRLDDGVPSAEEDKAGELPLAHNDFEANIPLLSAKGVDVREGILHTGGDASLYRDVLKSFVRDAQRKAQRMTADFEREDWEDYGIQAHSLKNSARTIGIKDLADLALAHELAAKDGHVENIRSGFRELMECYRAAVSTIREGLEHGDATTSDATPKEVPREFVSNVAAEAMGFLDTFEVEGALECLQKLDGCTCEGNDLAATLDPVIEDLNNFDIDAAMRGLETLQDLAS